MIQPSHHSLWLFAAWRTNWRDPFDGVYFEANTREVWLIFSVTGVLVAGVLLWQLFSSWNNGRLPSNSPRWPVSRAMPGAPNRPGGAALLNGWLSLVAFRPPVLLFVRPECFTVADLPDDLNEHAMAIVRLDEILFSTPSDVYRDHGELAFRIDCVLDNGTRKTEPAA